MSPILIFAILSLFTFSYWYRTGVPLSFELYEQWKSLVSRGLKVSCINIWRCSKEKNLDIALLLIFCHVELHMCEFFIYKYLLPVCLELSVRCLPECPAHSWGLLLGGRDPGRFQQDQASFLLTYTQCFGPNPDIVGIRGRKNEKYTIHVEEVDSDTDSQSGSGSRKA